MKHVYTIIAIVMAGVMIYHRLLFSYILYI